MFIPSTSLLLCLFYFILRFDTVAGWGLGVGDGDQDQDGQGQTKTWAE
jgi:hypothetical protein